MPEIDLQIKADPVQLKAFLNFTKSELCPQLGLQEPVKKDVLKKSNNTLIRAFGSTSKTMEVVTKLIIKERSALPTKGFPRTLKELAVTNIGCSQIPIGILNLTSLNSLDLSKNQITKLPKSFGYLNLSKLILSENKLGEAENISDWDWLNVDNIRKSLHFLSISRNNLKFIPSNIFKCLNLTNLDASINEISKIPFAIKSMSHLKTLNLSNNHLSSLPSTITKPRFDLIDLSSNRFPSKRALPRLISSRLLSMEPQHWPAPSLLELSSRAVIKHKIPFMSHNIPLILKDILFHSPLCANSRCEVLCFDGKIYNDINFIKVNSKQRITSDNADFFVSEGPYCSYFCTQQVMKKVSNY